MCDIYLNIYEIYIFKKLNLEIKSGMGFPGVDEVERRWEKIQTFNQMGEVNSRT